MPGEWPPAGGGGNPSEVAVLVGLQASGKSTFYRQHLAATHQLVSRDLFRNNPDPERRQRQLIADALRAGRSVAVDNTSPTVADRAAILEVARAHGARTVCYAFPRDVKASIARNARREGRARVPVVGILATAKRFVAPSAGEGFDRLVEVTPGEGGRFVLRQLHPPPDAASATLPPVPPAGDGAGGGAGTP